MKRKGTVERKQEKECRKQENTAQRAGVQITVTNEIHCRKLIVKSECINGGICGYINCIAKKL